MVTRIETLEQTIIIIINLCMKEYLEGTKKDPEQLKTASFFVTMMNQKLKNANKTITNKLFKPTKNDLIFRRSKTINSAISSPYRTKHS